MSLPTPNTRKEQYLNAIATGNSDGLPTPITREEEYLYAIAKSGGGSGDGDMKKSVYDSDFAVSNAGGIGAFVSDAVSGKVDKVEGKGLSTNDYDNTEKGKVADNTAAIDAINENGCCNILPNNAKSQTLAEGTITVNSDGSIRINISTTNGVAYDITDYFTVPSGDYIFSKGMSQIQSQIWLQFFNGSTFVKDVKLEMDASKPIVIDYDGYTQIKCVGYIPSNTTIDTTIYPMLYDARLNPTGYVPYAMTNRELTERVTQTSVYPICIEKTVTESTWLNITIPVAKGDSVTWVGASSASAGAFSTNVVGSDGHNYDLGNREHSNYNSPNTIGAYEALHDGTITFTSYTNTPTTFSNMSIAITHYV